MALLDDRVAIVTGAARGIGLATARLLSDHGARVVLCDLDEELTPVAAAGLGGPTSAVVCDLMTDAGPRTAVQAAITEFGRLDIVVNNAGFPWDGLAHKISDEQFMTMLRIHAEVPFRLLREAAPHLRGPAKRELAAGVECFRKVVNVTSISATQGAICQANYAAGKAAVIGLTKSLAKEWGRFKINVNAVAFGFVDTRLTHPQTAESRMRLGDNQVQLGIPESVRAGAPALIPLGRPATPEEAASVILFLCSPWSNYVHGQVITASGGYLGGMD
jgi:3-oxoacyl-[acyl-carrier protein] reductase